MKKTIVLILSVILLTAQAGICHRDHSLTATLAEESYCFDPDFIYDCF